MKKLLLLGICMVTAPLLFAQVENEDNPRARIEHEINITADPTLGRVPFERLIEEREKLNKGLKTTALK